MQHFNPLSPGQTAELSALDPLLALGPEDELPPTGHPRGRRLLALALAGLLLAMALLAAGYSAFGPPPTVERTRPLPELVPSQGAIR